MRPRSSQITLPFRRGRDHPIGAARLHRCTTYRRGQHLPKQCSERAAQLGNDDGALQERTPRILILGLLKGNVTR